MAGELLLDTSALVSLLDRSQTHHKACASFFKRWTRPVLTTEAVLTESTHLFGRVEGGAVLVPGSTEALERAEAIMRRYLDVDLDYADATLVVLAEDVGTEHVFTLDRRDFGALRWRGKRPFQVHP